MMEVGTKDDGSTDACVYVNNCLLTHDDFKEFWMKSLAHTQCDCVFNCKLFETTFSTLATLSNVTINSEPAITWTVLFF